MRAITVVVTGLSVVAGVGLAAGLVLWRPAVAGDAFAHANTTHGYSVESSSGANRIVASPENNTDYRDAFIGRGGDMSLTFEFMEADGSPEQCAPEQYIARNETPQTFRTGVDTTGHWVWTQGSDNYRLVKTILRSDGCLKMQMDYAAREVETWNAIGFQLIESFSDRSRRRP